MPSPFTQSGSDPDQRTAGSLRIVQFTDTHLHRDPEKRLLGVQTQHSFEHCLRLARARHWPPDLILLSGDLVHDGSDAGYRRLNAAVCDLGVPVMALPGNHDDPDRLARHLHVLDQGVLRADRWQVIALDSSVPDSDAGQLADSELRRLRDLLDQAPQSFSLITLHHHPVAIGSAWMDRIGLRNADALFDLLTEYPGARALLCGHVHQEWDRDQRGVRVLTSPSTCVQFAPRSEDFGVDPRPPGYRWLELHADGRIDTGVERLAALPDGLELASGGY